MLSLRRVMAAGALALTALVVPVAPASAGGGCHVGMEEGPTQGTGTTVELGKMCMFPTVLRVDPDATVTFVNRDPMVHNLYGAGFAHGDLQPGEATSEHFLAAGIYPYACTLHPGMVGAIVVGDGRGNGPVVAVSSYAPPTSVAAAPAAAVRPEEDDGGLSAGAIALIGAVIVGAFGAGVFVRRRRA